MTVASSSNTLALVILILITIHVIVSLSVTIIASDNESTSWNIIFWIISFVVCIVLFVLAAALYQSRKQVSETPCPVQISNAGDSSNVRSSIQNLLNAVQQTYGSVLQPYDPNATYLVITGTYLTGWNVPYSRAPFNTAKGLLQQYPYIPIGTLKDDATIYNLRGNEMWPDLTITPTPTYPTKRI